MERLKDPALVALLPRILKLVPDEFHSSAGGQVQKDPKVSQCVNHCLGGLCVCWSWVN